MTTCDEISAEIARLTAEFAALPEYEQRARVLERQAAKLQHDSILPWGSTDYRALDRADALLKEAAAVRRRGAFTMRVLDDVAQGFLKPAQAERALTLAVAQ